MSVIAFAAAVAAADQTFSCTPPYVWDGDGPLERPSLRPRLVLRDGEDWHGSQVESLLETSSMPVGAQMQVEGTLERGSFG